MWIWQIAILNSESTVWTGRDSVMFTSSVVHVVCTWYKGAALFRSVQSKQRRTEICLSHISKPLCLPESLNKQWDFDCSTHFAVSMLRASWSLAFFFNRRGWSRCQVCPGLIINLRVHPVMFCWLPQITDHFRLHLDFFSILLPALCGNVGKDLLPALFIICLGRGPLYKR